MIYSLGLFSDVGNAIVQGLRTFGGMIAASIYELIVYVYNIFTLLAKAEILDNDLVNAIYERVGLILGLFMVFKLTFTLIQSLIDPSKISDKTKGFAAIVQRSIIAIVLLGITPALFREAYKLQNLIIGSNSSSTNIIYKLIVGNTTGIKADSFGRTLASGMFFSFYNDEETPFYDNGLAAYEETIPERYSQENYETLKEKISSGEENFYFAISPLTFRNNGEFAIEFDFLFIMIVGVVILYILLIYCFQVATRVFQLAFLQLIAPIPILSYIAEPEGVFKKWVKQCTSTYLDLFIRVAIIYFVAYLSTYVFEQIGDASSVLMQSLGDIGTGTLVWITIFLIVGLLLFAKKVPELLKEIFPNLGGSGLSMGLGFKKNVLEPALSSPLAKPFGYMGKKAIGFADRKIHHLPKPRNKFQQWIDGVAPGHADAVKNKAEITDRKKLYNEGENIAINYTDSDGNLSQNAFKHGKFRDSWSAVEKAKKGKKDADASLEKYQQQVDLGQITTEDENYKSAKKAARAAEAQLAAAKLNHDNNRKIYSDDARREDAFSHYKDMNGGKITKVSNTSPEIQAEIDRRNQADRSAQERANEAQQHFNELNGINRSRASDNGAPTAEDSIFVKLDQEAKQEEFKNRNN